MNEKSVKSMVDELKRAQESKVLNDERKQFLLTEEEVLDRIVSGLQKDFKHL